MRAELRWAGPERKPSRVTAKLAPCALGPVRTATGRTKTKSEISSTRMVPPGRNRGALRGGRPHPRRAARRTLGINSERRPRDREEPQETLRGRRPREIRVTTKELIALDRDRRGLQTALRGEGARGKLSERSLEAETSARNKKRDRERVLRVTSSSLSVAHSLSLKLVSRDGVLMAPLPPTIGTHDWCFASRPDQNGSHGSRRAWRSSHPDSHELPQ